MKTAELPDLARDFHPQARRWKDGKYLIYASVAGIGARWISVETRWSRVTVNPVLPDFYPRAGDQILLIGNPIVADGAYYVKLVTEHEPPYQVDDAGRDIRIQLHDVIHKELHIDMVMPYIDTILRRSEQVNE